MTVSKTLQRIVLRPARGNGRLRSIEARGPIAASRGEDSPDAATETPSDGIASPITEIKVADAATPGSYNQSREYWETPRTVSSSDGLFTIEFYPLKTLLARDANQNEVTFQYQEVDPETGKPYPDAP